VGSTGDILRAALEAFGEAGYEQMSVRELARRLGVSHNLVSHYYGSKEALWRACVDYSVGEMNRELLAMTPALEADTDVVETLRALMERFVVLAARYPANLFIITQEGAAGGPRFDYLFSRLMEPPLRAWTALLEAAIERRHVRPIDPRTLFFLLTHGGATVFSLRPLAERIGGPPPLDPEFVRKHAKDVADILIRGIALEAAPARAKRK
jgi:AcrR family transcriptional regulator